MPADGQSRYFDGCKGTPGQPESRNGDRSGVLRAQRRACRLPDGGPVPALERRQGHVRIVRTDSVELGCPVPRKGAEIFRKTMGEANPETQGTGVAASPGTGAARATLHGARPQ